MKKNYIKPVSKTVITEMVLNTMDATAPNEKIGYGGEDNEGLDPGARERYKDFTDDQNSSTYSLW